jgi:RNA polymerase-binding protein
MSERALRGTRLGATSYETDSGIDLAPRQDVQYSCPNGHRFDMPFALEADVPPTWECRVCGAQALRVDGEAPEAKPGKPTRTHWDMLLERRSVADLEEVLAERLEVLRGGGIAYAARAAAEPALVDAASGVPTAARATAASRPSGGAPRPSAKNTAPTKKSAAAAPATRSAGKPVKKSPAANRAAGK